MSKQPIQPTEIVNGVKRFKPNAVVNYLLKVAPVDLNHLAEQGFPQADREQFIQLTGVSVSGFCDLPYASEEVKAIASGDIPDAGELTRFTPAHQMTVRLAIAKDLLGHILNSELALDSNGNVSASKAVKQAVLITDMLLSELESK